MTARGRGWRRRSTRCWSSLLVVAGFYHMQIGMRVIVEDYIHKPRSKALLLMANAFLCWVGTALAVICLLKVALLGAGA